MYKKVSKLFWLHWHNGSRTNFSGDNVMEWPREMFSCHIISDNNCNVFRSMKQIRKAARKVLRILPAEIYEFKKQVPRLISKNFHDNKWVFNQHIAVSMLHLHMSGKNQDISLEYSKAKLDVIPNTTSWCQRFRVGQGGMLPPLKVKFGN